MPTSCRHPIASLLPPCCLPATTKCHPIALPLLPCRFLVACLSPPYRPLIASMSRWITVAFLLLPCCSPVVLTEEQQDSDRVGQWGGDMRARGIWSQCDKTRQGGDLEQWDSVTPAAG